MQSRPVVMFICMFLTVCYHCYHKGYRRTEGMNSVDLWNSEGQQYLAAARCNFGHVVAPRMVVTCRCSRRVAETTDVRTTWTASRS